VFAVASPPRDRSPNQRGGKKKGRAGTRSKDALQCCVASVGLDVPGADTDESGASGAARTWDRRNELLDAEGVGAARGTSADTNTETDAIILYPWGFGHYGDAKGGKSPSGRAETGKKRPKLTLNGWCIPRYVVADLS